MSFTNLLFHIVYSTKFRKPMINAAWEDELYRYIGGIVRGQNGTLLSIGGVADHVHLLAKLSPATAISEVLQQVKANSSKWVNERSDVHLRFQWQPGYAAFSVSESQVEKLRLYIANQKQHHLKTSFANEFLKLLQKHGIEYDERYVFEQEIIS